MHILAKMKREVREMPNYKEMYGKLFRATESAIHILIAAQRECEDLYINAPNPELTFVPPSDQNE